MSRIPHGTSPVELRKFAQRVSAKVTGGEDPGHSHTGDSLSGIDISGDTNLAATSPIVLTGDTLSLNVGAVNHNSLLNTHNLTTDINHALITGAHNLTTDINHASITNTHNLTTDIDHASITNTHNLTTDINHGAISGLGDDDHTIYSLADGTRDFSGVVVGVDPVNSNHLATKEYVDSAISFIEEFFLTDTASGIGSYFNMVDQHTGEAESNDPTGSITQSDGQALTEWITEVNVPGMTDLEHGIYSAHVHVEKTGGGARDVVIYFEVYVRTHPGGVETLVTTSEISDLITSRISIDLHAVLTSDIATNATDRLVIKFFANGISGGNNATITLYSEGETASHFGVPTSSEVLSTIFLRQDGTKALTGNMAVDAAITIDGRDLSVDGTKLDGVEALADVTDATNVAVAGAAMSGGAFHDGFSDFVGNEHVDHTGVSIATAATSGISGGGTIASTRNLALNINGLTGESAIVGGDTLAFHDDTAGASRKITLTELSTALGAADEKVKVDSAATAGYLGAAAGDGVLRVNGALSYADNGDYITLGGSGSKAKAYLTSTPDIVTNTFTKVTLDTEDFDPENNFASGAYTAPATGYYFVCGKVRMGEILSSGKIMAVFVYVNGVEQVASRVSSDGVAVTMLLISDVVYVESGQDIELYVYHNHGSNRQLYGSLKQTALTVHRLS